MKRKFVVAHRRDINNVGDMASMPLQYFLSPDEYHIIDVCDTSNPDWNTKLPLILGGGGVFGNDFIGDVCESILTTPDRKRLYDLGNATWQTQNPRLKLLARQFHDQYQSLLARTLEKIPNISAPRFIWGAGHNSEQINADRVKYSRYLSEFRMVGLRDWHGEDSRYRWVPCASCMHEALRHQYPIRNDVIWFEHKKRMVKDFGDDSIPRFVNSGSNIDQTIELLASANIILTNSYHGAYWGTLLRRRVIVVDAWSTKFQHLRHAPVMLNTRKHHWKDLVDQAEIYPDALDQCRQANTEFWQDMLEQLGADSANTTSASNSTGLESC